MRTEKDVDVVELLRDLTCHLECLEELNLPESLQSQGDALLGRVRVILDVLQESPEPYLDMSADKTRLSIQNDETDYVKADSEKSSENKRVSLQQHYYESFQDYPQSNENNDKTNPKTDSRDIVLDDVALFYAGYSAQQAKLKATRHGQLLHLKRERKMFAPFNMFWLNKQHCWVSLVDSHLLVYNSDRDGRPYLVLPLRGYKIRPAPGAITRNNSRRNNEQSSFEIYCPGERTYQFATKNERDMRNWIDAVQDSCNLQSNEKHQRIATFGELLELESNEKICMERVKEERQKYQDVVVTTIKRQNVKTAQDSSLSSSSTSSSSSSTSSGDDKNKDVSQSQAPPLPARSTRRLPSLPSEDTYEPNKDEIYDEEGLYHRIVDVKPEYQNCQVFLEKKSSTVDLVQMDAYDDAETVTIIDQNKNNDEVDAETYDDVQSSSQPRKTSASNNEDKTEILQICNNNNNNNSTRSSVFINEEDYLTPPTPRPIYSRPPTIIKCALVDEIYDDIGEINVNVIKNYPKNGSFLSDLQLSIDKEYYQVPKSGNRRVNDHVQEEQPEEFYDDVALSKTFKNHRRQRENSKGSSTNNDNNSVWSRFGSGKRPRILDHLSRQITSSTTTTSGDVESTIESVDAKKIGEQSNKVKSLQKFINKMENTLGKSSKTNSGVA